MQFSITVDQFAYQTHFPNLNFCHAAIVDWFSRHALGISSRDSFWQIVEDLCNEKILKRHPADSAYFAFGDRYPLTFSEGYN